jgi:hypothetical protein
VGINPYQTPEDPEPPAPRWRALLLSALFELSVVAAILSGLWMFVLNFVTFVEPISGETHLLSLACVISSFIAMFVTSWMRQSDQSEPPSE